MGSSYSHFTNPDGTPDVFEKSAFDPMFGFEDTGRKVRETTVSQEQLASILLPLSSRDYCSKELLELQACKYYNFPLFKRCEHETHVHAQCLFDDYVIRMKEYERERRLMERAKRVGPERAGYAVKPVQG